MRGLGLGLGLGLGGRRTSVAPAWQSILELAAVDGWLAVYDVGNFETLTIREAGGASYVASLADGLGNLPPAVQATEARQPTLAKRALGRSDALFFPVDDVNGLGLAVTFGSQNSAPNFIMAACQFTGSLPCETDRTLYSGQGASQYNRLYYSRFAGDYYPSAGTPLLAGHVDGERRVHATLFNGASSIDWLNGDQTATGTTGSLRMDGLAIGNINSFQSSRAWQGYIGPLLFFDGVPPADVRNRMTDLLLSTLRVKRTFGLNRFLMG